MSMQPKEGHARAQLCVLQQRPVGQAEGKPICFLAIIFAL